MRAALRDVVICIESRQYRRTGMKNRSPTSSDIDDLVAFLPRLISPGFNPIKSWGGGFADASGAYVSPWPIYHDAAEKLLTLAAQECWTDYDYDPVDAQRLLLNPESISQANLCQIKTILTFCVRSERFVDGNWAELIRNGTVQRLLLRLSTLRVLHS